MSRKENREATPETLRCLALNLKRLRKARGYTQADLARRTGLGLGYIRDVERETVNVALVNLEALAHGLNCSFHDLLMPIEEG